MNTFEDPDGMYVVLVNSEGQHSLWPAGGAIPDGWIRALGESSLADSLAYVENEWTDMRPRSVLLQE
jgi:MbtH protein